MLTLHALRIKLDKSYRGTVDLLSEMPGLLEEIRLTRLPHYTALRTWFARISTATWRAFLGISAEKRTGHAALDSIGFDRDQPRRHYPNRTHSRVRALKAFRDELRENDIRPLIKHRIVNSLDHAHNARIDGERYHQRSMSGTVFSSIKRTLGSPVRARSW